MVDTTRRDFLKFLGRGAGALAAAGCAAPWKKGRPFPEKPNIVVLLADDLGYGDPQCLNPDSRIPTPNIDRLAREGLTATDAHSPSAVCTPTRYGLLTGRYCWRSRLKRGVLWGWSKPLIERDRTTLASFLKSQGYVTGCFGKWHLGLGWVPRDPSRKPGPNNVDYSKPLTYSPAAIGFDESCVIPASLDMDPYCWIENGKLLEAPTGHTPGSKRRWSGGGGFWRAGPMAPSFDFYQVLPEVTEKSVEFIRSRKKDEPFFLYVPFPAPHTPWMPLPRFRGKSKAGWYGDYVVEVDWAVGRILSALDERGLSGNTLVVFTSDNGSHWPKRQIEKYHHRANDGLRGQKADIWDGGHRIPFLCRWPGRIPAGSRTDQTICLTDLLATFAAILGEDLPLGAGPDSYDILPALLHPGLKEPIREATVHHSVDGMFAVRRGRWKLILGRGSGGFTRPRRIKPKPGEPAGQLYDMKADLPEKHNLYLERPDVVRRLKAILERYKRAGRSVF